MDVSNKELRTFDQSLIKSMSEDGGLKTIEKMIAGEISSGGLCETLKIKFDAVEYGKMTLSCLYDPVLHSNPFGVANGGWHGAMLDNAAGYAGLSTLDPGYGGFTKVMSDISFLRPVVSGVFYAHGTVVSRDGHRISCAGKIVDQHDEIYASTELILSVRSLDEIRENLKAFGVSIKP